MKGFYSQCGQDRFVYENFFKNHRDGIFVDVGAHDGITFNNTLFLEKENGWSGINIEPNDNVYQRLIENRPNSINLNVAVSEEEGELEFIKVSGAPEMISGLAKHYDPRHENRLDIELKRDGGKRETVLVKSKRLDNIFQENGIKNVNYLSIDVEGGELSVIKSINFDKVFIDIIGFENNYNDASIPIIDYLKQKKYISIGNVEIDIFMIHEDSKFRK